MFVVAVVTELLGLVLILLPVLALRRPGLVSGDAPLPRCVGAALLLRFSWVSSFSGLMKSYLESGILVVLVIPLALFLPSGVLGLGLSSPSPSVVDLVLCVSSSSVIDSVLRVLSSSECRIILVTEVSLFAFLSSSLVLLGVGALRSRVCFVG